MMATLVNHEHTILVDESFVLIVISVSLELHGPERVSFVIN